MDNLGIERYLFHFYTHFINRTAAIYSTISGIILFFFCIAWNCDWTLIWSNKIKKQIDKHLKNFFKKQAQENCEKDLRNNADFKLSFTLF